MYILQSVYSAPSTYKVSITHGIIGLPHILMAIVASSAAGVSQTLVYSNRLAYIPTLRIIIIFNSNKFFLKFNEVKLNIYGNEHT